MTKRSRILVANRGEIAVRIVRACHTAGHEAVAVYSDTDKNARWVRMADEALHIGGSPAPKSYLNTDSILEAAKYAEVDAVHPGYGFLSENAAFARAVTTAGFTFIGPPPEVIELMGDKASARSAAAAAGVPVVPGSRPVTDTDDAVRVAEEIGYPILVKAAAGGGGRGIRPVQDATQLTEVFAGARAEAQSAFGDGTAYLERALPRARHVEVQLLADHHGNLVHLFERDCSVQRRRQKLLEEAPAPDLGEHTRNELGEAAKRLGEHVGYRNAGTVEFLVDPDGRFYFIEMNTRVQVEHPITEAITGVDLVVEQLRIADGASLSLTQDAARHSGAAVELRINAEDPDNDFLPTPGEITSFEAPGGPGVRLDTALTRGEQISPFYDSLIAKLVCWGADRRQAYARARQALSEFRVEGVANTIPLHRELIDDLELTEGPVHTTWLEERA